MSNLSAALSLVPSETQLPVSAYFDEALYQIETERLFKHGPGYVGHELMVPEVGDYHTPAAEVKGRVLVRNPNGVELLSNVCRHRQAIMLNGCGNAQNIVCPLHRWTYGLQGDLLGTPHLKKQPCVRLSRLPLQNWNGLLSEDKHDVCEDPACPGVTRDLDSSGYMLNHVEVHDCNYDWETFTKVCLEDYHAVPLHPGLGQFVLCDDLEWELGEWHSVQTVGIHANLRKPGTPAYQKWYDTVLRFNNGGMPKYGAVWLTYYPNVMVEWYPSMLVVSTLHPLGPAKTRNVVEFYYSGEVVLFERELVEAKRVAYMETCIEDDGIAERMDAGRLALLKHGMNEIGPYQSPVENGMQHFHEWYRRTMHY